jgi:hypothetical protein
MREQSGFDEHAQFMDALVADGFVVLGGPIDEGEVLLVVECESEAEIRRRLATDPWLQSGMLAITAFPAVDRASRRPARRLCRGRRRARVYGRNIPCRALTPSPVERADIAIVSFSADTSHSAQLQHSFSTATSPRSSSSTPGSFANTSRSPSTVSTRSLPTRARSARQRSLWAFRS